MKEMNIQEYEKSTDAVLEIYDIVTKNIRKDLKLPAFKILHNMISEEISALKDIVQDAETMLKIEGNCYISWDDLAKIKKDKENAEYLIFPLEEILEDLEDKINQLKGS